MPLPPLDQVANLLETAVMDRADFEGHFGKRAAAFLDALPALFRLYRRLPYDEGIPLEVRRLCAAVALYIAEHQDFLDDKNRSRTGLIDDVWLAYAILPQVVEAAGEAALERHWRSEHALADVIGLAENAGELKQHVPSKVLERLKTYLGEAG